MQRIFMALIAAFFGWWRRELAVGMTLGTGHGFVSFKQREVGAWPVIDLHHILALYFDRARLKMAFKALAVFEFLSMNVFVLMAPHALAIWPQFFELCRAFAAMTSATIHLRVFPGKCKIAVLGVIKNRWFPIDRRMTNAALRRFAKFAEAFAVFIVFGVALLASTTRLGFANCFGVALVALHLVVSLT